MSDHDEVRRMTEVEEILATCPPQVLFHRGRPKRIGRLERWCRRYGIAPTLLQVENERNRRREADAERKSR